MGALLGVVALTTAFGPLISCASDAVRASDATTLSPLPRGWPAVLELGVQDDPGDAAATRRTAPFRFRYQYLAGGANTGRGWATWEPEGNFATRYIAESLASGMIPVFDYYMLAQSSPGDPRSDADAVYANLQDALTMAAYYADLRSFLRRAGAFPAAPVVLHVEPDLWGFMQQRAVADRGPSVPARVAAAGLPELAGLPDDLAGFAGAFVRLRDLYAPNVLLAYHISVWGTGIDLAYSDPPDPVVDDLAARASSFHRSLNAAFDLAFAEFSDRDAAFREYAYRDGGASWWDDGDFRRSARFLGRFARLSGKRVALWQIPLGNTRMRAMHNTWNHFQDNRVERLLDDPSRRHLEEYVRAGVIALLFGRGADGATCACDAAGDGITDPPPINGNYGLSLSADDDGGFFRQKARDYYASVPIPLPP